MGKWAPGVSGNRGGRPKTTIEGLSLTHLARQHTETALTTLVSLLNAESEAVRCSAAEALLSRGWGRPKQDLGIELKSDDATASLLEAARKRASAGGSFLPAD